MKQIIGFVVVIIGLITAPLAVLGQNTADAEDPVAIYKQAGINAEQESSIRKLAQEYDQESAVKVKALTTLMHGLRELAYQPKLDASALLAKQAQINKLQSEMATDRIQMIIKIRSILTGSQNEKLASILQGKMQEEQQAPALK
jgi:Spy/CpxP family protein refolding chaperone